MEDNRCSELVYPVLVFSKDKFISYIPSPNQFLVTKKALKDRNLENSELIDCNFRYYLFEKILSKKKLPIKSLFDFINPIYLVKDVELSNSKDISLKEIKVKIKDYIYINQDFWESGGDINLILDDLEKCTTIPDIIDAILG